MGADIIIAYKINNSWIYVDDLKKIPRQIDGLKINDYVFEDFEQIGCIIEAFSTFGVTNYIVWITLKRNNELSLYKLNNKELIKIPLFNFKKNA